MTDVSLTFRPYLLRPAVLALVLALWAALFIVTWAMYQQFRGLLVEQGTQLTQQFAQRGVTLLLVEDPALVKQTVEAFRDYPGVRYLAIRDQNGKVRVQEGVQRFDRGTRPGSGSGARLLREDSDRWQFIAPVHTGSDASLSAYSDDRQRMQVIGYVLVDIDKASLRALVATLAPINLIVGVALSLIVVAWAKNDALKLHAAYLEAEIALRLQEVIATRDRLLSQQERRAEFLATVTHEMRTPLTGILGNVQLALEEIEVYEENSKGFCELMGGRISVESKPQTGSTFTVVIPLPITAPAARDVPPRESR